jgi:hypothetical protein
MVRCEPVSGETDGNAGLARKGTRATSEQVEPA